jgi:hypothetical protein
MSSFLRHCVECPKCLTRYLIAFTPYRNGSYLVRTDFGSSEEYILYCSCGRPPVSSRWKWSEVRRYSVSKVAHGRGFGTPQETMRLLALNFVTREKNSNDIRPFRTAQTPMLNGRPLRMLWRASAPSRGTILGFLTGKRNKNHAAM